MMVIRDGNLLFFFNDTATTEIYTLSLHDALPISRAERQVADAGQHLREGGDVEARLEEQIVPFNRGALQADRKSTRLNSSHSQISYAVFCLKKKQPPHRQRRLPRRTLPRSRRRRC